MKKNVKGALALFLTIMTLTASGLYVFTPVRAKVFDVNLPNIDPGVLSLKLIGSYEFHLSDLNISGFFKVDDETVNYHLNIGSADVVYSAELNSEFNLTIKYNLCYKDLKFSVISESFSVVVDYVQVSTTGELLLTLLGDDIVNIKVYEMVPRWAATSSKWSPLEFLIAREF